MKHIKIMGIITILTMLLSGCATIIRGSEDTVTLKSSEQDTLIYVNNKFEGNNLTVVELERGEYHMISGRKVGCNTTSYLTNYEFDLITLWDILFISWIVPPVYDILSGNMWQIEHNVYDVTPACN